MQQKKILFIAAILIVILAISGGVLVFSQRHTASTGNVQTDDTQAEAVPSLAPSAIGLGLAVSRGGKSVTMTADQLDDIISMDYEVTYTANNSGNDVPRGVIGHIDVKPGVPINQEVVLGTCSDVCHYDTVVSPVKFSIKVTKKDGKVYEVEQQIRL